MSLKEKLHTGHLKALFILLPLTAMLSPYLYLFSDVAFHIRGLTSLRFWALFFFITSTILGFLGLWLANLFQNRLDVTKNDFNRLVSALLISMIASGVGTALFLVFWVLSHASEGDVVTTEFFIFIAAIVLAVYAARLLRRVFHLGKWSKD